MKTNDTKEKNRRAGRVISRLGRVALLCLGLLAMLTMALVVVILAPVVFLATVIPASKEDRHQQSGRYETQIWHRDPGRQGNLIEEQR